MGPPPSYVVTRRLVRNFFRKYIPNKPEGSEISEDALFDCWRKHGIDHPNCQDAEDTLGDAIEARQNYRQKLAHLRIRQNIMSELHRPTYPSDQKGKFREQWYNKEWTIYDGLKK